MPEGPQERRDAVASLAHELAAPVATMRVLVARLKAPDWSRDDLCQIVNAIDLELSYLSALIRDAQLLSTASAGDIPVVKRPVPLREIVRAAQNYGQTFASAHPVLWPELDNTWVWADAERMMQVLRNLLANAVKYSPPGSLIEVGIKKHHNRVHIAVIDHGSGINPEDADRIFQKFERGQHQNSGIPGMGIGLYLARAIVRAHGSDLALAQTPGGGATFAFELAVADPPASAVQERTPAPCAAVQ